MTTLRSAERPQPLFPDNTTILVRLSVSPPPSADALGRITALARQGARIAIIAGLGDPGGDINPALSLQPFAGRIAEALGLPVSFIRESLGSGAEAGLDQVGFGEVALLENLRFHPDERRAAPVFAMRLAVLGDHFLDLGETPAKPGSWQHRLAHMLPAPTLPEPIEPETKEA